MHIIIEQMFIMWHGQHMHAGTRISCDNGQSWVIECKRVRGLHFRRDQVKSFESRHREITWSEWKHRQHYNLKFGITT